VAEQQQDVDALKRRGRRRLVGAVALVLLAVIVLPMVFDAEPRSSAPPVSVRIPGEDEAPFAPKLPAKPAAKPAVEAKKEAPKPEEPKAEAPKAEAPKPEPVKAPAPKPKAPEVEKPKIAGNALPGKAPAVPKAPAPAERARAEAALTGQGQYFVPVGAFSSPQPVIAKLKEAKVPYYTEDLAVKEGRVTRVRAGPFASKDAADKALERLKGLGFKPGNVAAKAG
jgi:DedD protein